MPLNDSNFLVWFPANEAPSRSNNLPRPFEWEPDVQSPVVWLVAGDQVSFYVNTTANNALAGPLQIETEKGNLLNVPTQALATISFPEGTHTHGSFTVPAGLAGLVRLRLGTNRTQWLWAATAQQAAPLTAIVSFRNSRRLQNIRYGYLPDGYQQRFRIRLAVGAQEPMHNKEVYTESDTGKRRHLYSEPGWVTTFLTPEYDFWGHRAMASLIEHDYITINGKEYTYQGPYKANSVSDRVLTQGEVELREEKYSTLHRA